MPLRGIKVIELGGLAPGPLCGKFLRDFGASVTVVNKVADEIAVDVNVVNDGKELFFLDIKSPSGSDVFRKLVKSADVLIEPFRAGVMEKLKFGPKELLADNPKLIYARLTGYGQSGPLSKVAGHDINYLSLTGLLSFYGWRGKYPIPPSNFSEFAGGSLLCFTGILLALIDRSRTGKGQVIDSNIVEGISYIGSWLMWSKNTLFNQPRGNNWLDGGAHFYDTYETKDGKFMAVGALEPKFYEELISKLGFSYEEAPQLGNNEVREKFQKRFLEKTQDEWVEVFGTSDACVTPVLSLQEAVAFKHNLERGSFHQDEDGVITPVRAPRLSNYPEGAVQVPNGDNDTYKVLQRLGYSDEEIKELEAEEIVKCKI